MTTRGVYRIINTLNQHCYVGSSKDIKRRWVVHKSRLRNNTHHSIYLQRAVNKYGLNAFVLEVLEETKDLFKREQFWIDSSDSSYNVGLVGGGDNTSRHPDNAGIRKRISKSQKGRKGTPRYGKDNPNWKGGIPKCLECGTDIERNNKSGRCIKHNKKEGKDNPFWGKKHAKETKDKLSAANKGKLPINCRSVKINKIDYVSITEASRILGVCPATVIYRIKSKNYTNYKYKKEN